LFDFRLFGQNWYAALNPFLDAGAVVQPYRLAEQMTNAELYSGRDESIHASAGVGLKLVMNHNFVISAEWGKPFNSQDGTDGLNIGLNYIF
jgi:hemolysin activation/secretion protein